MDDECGRTVWKNMTYDNALKAITVAAAVPVMAAGAGAVGAGIAAGSATQVLGGLATGLSAASTMAPSLGPTATAASHLSGAASAASAGMARARERRSGQPMTAQAYLNEYGIRRSNPAWGTRAQYAAAQS